MCYTQNHHLGCATDQFPLKKPFRRRKLATVRTIITVVMHWGKARKHVGSSLDNDASLLPRPAQQRSAHVARFQISFIIKEDPSFVESLGRACRMRCTTINCRVAVTAANGEGCKRTRRRPINGDLRFPNHGRTPFLEWKDRKETSRALVHEFTGVFFFLNSNILSTNGMKY